MITLHFVRFNIKLENNQEIFICLLILKIQIKFLFLSDCFAIYDSGVDQTVHLNVNFTHNVYHNLNIKINFEKQKIKPILYYIFRGILSNKKLYYLK